jgi:hypothetical protein
MSDPVYSCITSQRKAVSDIALFNALVRPEQNTQASLHKNCMRRLKEDMKPRGVSTRGAEPIRGQELLDREMRELYDPGFIGFYDGD